MDDAAKKSRTRALNRLGAVKVSKLKDVGLYEDGGGLRLVVTEVGTKRWVLRLTINGQRVERGLGVWPSVSLDDARRKSEDLRRAARDGRDAQSDTEPLRVCRRLQLLRRWSHDINDNEQVFA